MSIVVNQLEKARAHVPNRRRVDAHRLTPTRPQEYGSRLKIVKIETDPNPALVEKYGVYGLPTVILFKDGKEVAGSKREGARGLLLQICRRSMRIARRIAC